MSKEYLDKLMGEQWGDECGRLDAARSFATDGHGFVVMDGTFSEREIPHLTEPIKKLLSSSRYLLPVHDRPAKIEGGNVVGRLHDQVPGPIVQSLPQRNWFPA